VLIFQAFMFILYIQSLEFVWHADFIIVSIDILKFDGAQSVSRIVLVPGCWGLIDKFLASVYNNSASIHFFISDKYAAQSNPQYMYTGNTVMFFTFCTSFVYVVFLADCCNIVFALLLLCNLIRGS
jgi:hypothetical protein